MKQTVVKGLFYLAGIALTVVLGWYLAQPEPSPKSQLISGRVIDSTGLSPIPNAAVTVTGIDLPQTEKSDSNGVFSFTVQGGLPESTLILTVNAQGYEPDKSTHRLESYIGEIHLRRIGVRNPAPPWKPAGEFGGIVVDEDTNIEISQAEVRIVGVLDVSVTDDSGWFGFESPKYVKNSSVRLRVTKAGYRPREQEYRVRPDMHIQLTKQ
jgi:hypothetical protein